MTWERIWYAIDKLTSGALYFWILRPDLNPLPIWWFWVGFILAIVVGVGRLFGWIELPGKGGRGYDRG